jgi:hypothetical protein
MIFDSTLQTTERLLSLCFSCGLAKVKNGLLYCSIRKKKEKVFSIGRGKGFKKGLGGK